MEKIKTDFLSKLLYSVIIGGLIIATIALGTLPWCVESLFRGSAFYAEAGREKVLLLLYVTGIPAWLVLWFTRGLAKNIIQRNPFSASSTICLKGISICAIVIFCCYALTSILLSATFGIIVITIGAFMVALIAAVLYRLVGMAIEIKEENELTI